MTMTNTEWECRWNMWRAAFDFFGWSNQEATLNVSGFIWNGLRLSDGYIMGTGRFQD